MIGHLARHAHLQPIAGFKHGLSAANAGTSVSPRGCSWKEITRSEEREYGLLNPVGRRGLGARATRSEGSDRVEETNAYRSNGD
jgi:hypothetical protein